MRNKPGPFRVVVDAHLDAIAKLLEGRGVEIEYAELRDPQAWSPHPPTGKMMRAQALVAAQVGKVRLIDTLRLDGND